MTWEIIMFVISVGCWIILGYVLFFVLFNDSDDDEKQVKLNGENLRGKLRRVADGGDFNESEQDMDERRSEIGKSKDLGEYQK